jgi:hypothetical protein
VQKPDEAAGATIVTAVLRPTVQASVTLKEYGKTYGDLDLTGLVDALTVQIKAVADGDLERGEAMMTTQGAARTRHAPSDALGRPRLMRDWLT